MHEKHPQQEGKPRLRLVRGEPSSPKEIPKLGPEELERICRLDFQNLGHEGWESRIDDTNSQSLLQALLERDFKNELPVEEPIFLYRRNIQECERMRKKILTLMKGGKVPKESGAEYDALVNKLFALEYRKAQWLEETYYPAIFGKAVKTARAEVNQFLVRQKNTKTLEQFRDARLPEIRMMDELEYLLEKNPEDSDGVYHPHTGSIDLRIPEGMSERDEWRVYLLAVHELLHSVSHQDWEGVGMDKRLIEPSLEALNEAVTQLLTYSIASQHHEKQKTALFKEKEQPLSLMNMPYSKYTLLVKQVLGKIPMEYFTNAMLNRSGWKELQQKCMEVFGTEDAVIRFAKNLHDAYLPPRSRGKGAKIIPFRGKPKMTLKGERSEQEEGEV